ncbi:MAG: BON domain-containing protein, partial [Comamonadaceae bacterium]|nr:BON domain-containing protein [Comamonadaceae bacterium]
PPLPVVREAPTPAVKAPTPGPEALAQARPREPALQPLAPPVVTPEQAPPQAAPVVPPVAQQTPPAAPDAEDGGITVQVRLALAADATLAAVPIAVSTEHGVVRLEGQAPDAQVRERATLVAAATTGVKAVDNRLTLPPLAAHQAAGNGG